MDGSLKAEINDCIRELYAISNELEEVSADLQSSIVGMVLFPYTMTLELCASKYRIAARKLERIK